MDHQRLVDRIGQWAQAPVASSVGGQVVLLGAVLAAAGVAGLAAQALGTLVRRAVLAAGWRAWPRPFWWPAAPVSAVLALTARFRLRAAVDAYAQLLEAAVRLHAVELAVQLGTEHAGPLDRLLGDVLTQHLRTRTRGA
ncbi:hypothetical protein [Streptomyces albidochromogenes]|uniref:Uncharacterized protein n=1 Tax=Streptomyces albidochromogenes TaxID=329524 RepID=A0ABW6FR41_9ACTN